MVECEFQLSPDVIVRMVQATYSVLGQSEPARTDNGEQDICPGETVPQLAGELLAKRNGSIVSEYLVRGKPLGHLRVDEHSGEDLVIAAKVDEDPWHTVPTSFLASIQMVSARGYLDKPLSGGTGRDNGKPEPPDRIAAASNDRFQLDVRTRHSGPMALLSVRALSAFLARGVPSAGTTHVSSSSGGPVVGAV
jgi:hypothetical protein